MTLEGNLDLSQEVYGRVRLRNGAMWTGTDAAMGSGANVLAFEYTATLVGKTIDFGNNGTAGSLAVEGDDTQRRSRFRISASVSVVILYR